MQPLNHPPWHNIYIYASDNGSTALRGLWAAKGITNANPYFMLQVFCFFTDSFDLRNSSEHLVERDGQQLQPGNYYIVTAGSTTVTDEAALPHLDWLYIITARPAQLAHLGSWDTFKATHIFPMAYKEFWNDCKYSHWITIPPANESDGTMNSVQNGILLAGDIHSLFNSYKLTINPDDDKKIMCFTSDTHDYNIAGRHPNQSFLNISLWPVDQILHWHFHQAVPGNIKGAGEACFEANFPPGSDMISKIIRSAKAVQRMEYELFSCFNARGIATEGRLGYQPVCT
ncbi:hypothetical protein HOY80DRAFT_1061874 [Tuber brumale]|nr:hypothetical protein HOY80DRAFT_1061874 [Tuber brumale]